jgi:hypothetical protein
MMYIPCAVRVVQAAIAAVPGPQLTVLEGQLTWLVYIIGSIIKGRLSSSSAESQVGEAVTKTAV